MRFAAGLVTGAFATCLIAFFGALASGSLTPSLAGGALMAGTLLGWLAARQSADEPRPPLKFWDWVVLALFAFVSFRSYFWLLFEFDGEWLVQSRYNLGDLALHLNFIQYFASGVPFWPESPIFQGEPLRYPIGSDLFNSLLLLVGVPLQPGLIWVGLAGAALTACLLWRWSGAFGVASLLMVGGLAGISYFRTWQLSDIQGEMEWKNLFLCLFVTQRAFLFALPAGLLLLLHWRRQLEGRGRLLPRWSEVLLYAGLPFFSVHTFLFLSAVLLLQFLMVRSQRGSALLCVALAFVPASLLVWFVGGGFGGQSFIGWHPGWMQPLNATFGEAIQFWFWNFGLMIPLMIATVVLVTRSRDQTAAPFVLSAALFFLICAFVRFSPWPWDNTKLMLWCWLTLAPFIWRWCLVPMPRWGRVLVCTMLFFTGLISVLSAMTPANRFALIRTQELHDAAAAVRGLPATARFVAKPDYNHPLLLLGRPVVCGYDGHLWSHGYDYGVKYNAMQDAMNGKISWPEAAKRFDFDYVFSGPREERAYGRPSEAAPVVIPKSQVLQ